MQHRARWRTPQLLLLGLLLAAGAPGKLGAQSAQVVGDWQRVVIPMDHSTDLLQLQVMIADQGPFLFQLDTYASIDACVDDDFAKLMGFQKTGTTLNSDGETTRRRDLVRIDALQVGAAHFSGLRALVDNYDWIDKEGRKVHGLLGFQLFRELLLTIDYPGSQIVLERGRLAEDEAHCLPMLTTAGAPDIYLNLGQEATLFGIDTGMGMPLLLRLTDAERLGLSDQLRAAGRAHTVYSSFELFKTELQETLDLAGHQITAPLALFRGGEVKRLLGKGLLKPFALTFDQRSKKLRIVVPEAATRARSLR